MLNNIYCHGAKKVENRIIKRNRETNSTKEQKKHKKQKNNNIFIRCPLKNGLQLVLLTTIHKGYALWQILRSTMNHDVLYLIYLTSPWLVTNHTRPGSFLVGHFLAASRLGSHLASPDYSFFSLIRSYYKLWIKHLFFSSCYDETCHC